MEAERAAEFLRALADGVDPFTGEVVDDSSPLQNPECIRALFAAAEALEGRASGRSKLAKRNRDLPGRTGKPWNEREDGELTERFDAGWNVADLCEASPAYAWRMDDLRLHCVEDTPDRTFWNLWGEPALVSEYGVICFGDIELQNQQVLIASAMSTPRMAVLMDLLAEDAGGVGLPDPAVKHDPIHVFDKRTRKRYMLPPRRCQTEATGTASKADMIGMRTWVYPNYAKDRTFRAVTNTPTRRATWRSTSRIPS